MKLSQLLIMLERDACALLADSALQAPPALRESWLSARFHATSAMQANHRDRDMTDRQAADYIGRLGSFLMLAAAAHADSVDRDHLSTCPTCQAIGQGHVALNGARATILAHQGHIATSVHITGGRNEWSHQQLSALDALAVVTNEAFSAAVQHGYFGTPRAVTLMAGDSDAA